ncbi:MAG: hypothetical protein AAGJ82_14985 [Bacteroidota bacterium]
MSSRFFAGLLIVPLVLLMTTITSAQSPVPITLERISCDAIIDMYYEDLAEIITKELRTDQRVVLREATNEPNAAQQEIDLQKQEDFLEGEVTEVAGTDELSVPQTLALTTSYRRKTGIITFELHQEGNSAVIARQQLRLETGIFKTIRRQKGIILIGLRRLLAQYFSITVPVVKQLEGNEKRARTLLVAGGAAQGFYFGQALYVFPKDTPDQAIGTLEILQVEGERFSKCDVKKGSKAIAAALAAGEELLVRE